ncbi:unnamed protein product [Rotaria sordida]|nr:unnamed protein product [Rotaria sordida]
MNRREQRRRPNTVTRTYPIYTIPSSELSDDDDNESIIEIKPIKRYRHHRKQPLRIEQQKSIIPSVVTDNYKSQLIQVKPKRKQQSATIQTDEIPTILSATEKNEESS